MIKKVVLIAVVCLLILWLNWPLVPPTVEFVLPDGFKGPFLMIEDSDGGENLIKTGGVVTVKVPASRLLKVKSWKLLSDEHRETVHYEGGGKIAIGPQAGPDPGGATVALRACGREQFNQLPVVEKYFVGTEDESYAFDWQAFTSECLAKK